MYGLVSVVARKLPMGLPEVGGIATKQTCGLRKVGWN